MGVVGGLFKLGLLGLAISWVALYFRYGDHIDAMEYSLPSPPEFSGVLAPNDVLEKKTSYILKDQIVGPESIVVEGENIYTGLYDGRVVQITEGKIVREVRFTKEKKCGSFDTEPRCGRPLGMRRLSSKEFVVADAYLGVYSVNFDTGKFRQLVRAAVPVNGHPMRFVNDIDVLNEDEIIFSDSSFTWDRRHFMNAILAQNGEGRVFHHKISTGETKVLASDLNFVNGVQLLNPKTLLVAECSMARIWKVDLVSGERTIFAENLPGLPDNIRKAEDGTIWVGLAGIRQAGKPSLVDLVGPYARLRQILIDVVPGQFWLWFFPKVKPPHSLIVQMNSKGQIVRSLHDVNGKSVADSSQVTPSGNRLYIGSYHALYVAVVDL